MSYKRKVEGSGSGDHVSKADYILSLDVGTTTIRAHVYDGSVKIKGTGSRKVVFIYVQGEGPLVGHCLFLLLK